MLPINRRIVVEIIDNVTKIDTEYADTDQKLLRLKEYLIQWNNHKLTGAVLGRIYEIVNPPDEDGFSESITIDELVTYHPSFRTSNGGDWCRADNGSYLGKKYIVKNTKSNNRIESVKLDGFNKGLRIKQNINPQIKKQLAAMRCAILDISSIDFENLNAEMFKIETDHKNGKKDEHYMNNIDEQSMSDFQPLSKAANDAKREHCKKCKTTVKT